jgi:abortive infection bacteriophage resistance protein
MTLYDQLGLLRSRGLLIDDETEAIRLLDSVSYYRLAAYLSHFYCNLRRDLAARDEIAAYFLVPPKKYFSGWLQSITQVRNICAHHARL